MGERPTMVNCILLADYLDANTFYLQIGESRL
jgi:hypothetical protein